MPSDEALLDAHKLHLGLYRRLADKLGVDPSFVSRVASGNRKDWEVRHAILDELRRIQRQSEVKNIVPGKKRERPSALSRGRSLEQSSPRTAHRHNRSGDESSK
jgi:hypothetical protein